MMQDANIPARFNETVVIMEDQTWIWQLVTGKMTQLGLGHVRLPSTVPLRQSWDRLKHAEYLIILWEGKQRSGGAIIEEILSVQANFDVGGRIIVLTTNPTHEDVVYFSELGVNRIIRLRNRDKDLQQSEIELAGHLAAHAAKDPNEEGWRRVHLLLDSLGAVAAPETLAKIEDSVRGLKTGEYTARYLDALATINMFKGNDAEALKQWQLALEKNPNYYRTYHNLIDFHRRRGRAPEAYALMQKMHELNKQNIARLVGMAEIQMEGKDLPRAEFYFSAALNRDPFCSGALNGLAEIRFHSGDLEEARRLLSRSQQAYKTAAVLNQTGIEMVRQQKYQAALDHYTRAQYVLPQQDKGPLLVFNIGLCYTRWGRYQIALEFIRIALIKEPNFKKAQSLLAQVEQKLAALKGHVAA